MGGRDLDEMEQQADYYALCARIEALRDEWRAVANPTPGYEYAMADAADALVALLREGE